jgi:hypothetical protein
MDTSPVLSAAAQQAFSECSVFYRDTVLPPAVLSMYRVGTIFREPTFCDATYKFGGFAAPHRYLIISANARCIDALSQHPEWGLCVWLPGRIFKIIGTSQNVARAQITLLELPDELRVEFTTESLSPLERIFAHKAAQEFDEALQLPVLPEHGTRLWLDRLALPLGVNDDEEFFESWFYGAA